MDRYRASIGTASTRVRPSSAQYRSRGTSTEAYSLSENQDKPWTGTGPVLARCRSVFGHRLASTDPAFLPPGCTLDRRTKMEHGSARGRAANLCQCWSDENNRTERSLRNMLLRYAGSDLCRFAAHEKCRFEQRVHAFIIGLRRVGIRCPGEKERRSGSQRDPTERPSTTLPLVPLPAQKTRSIAARTPMPRGMRVLSRSIHFQLSRYRHTCTHALRCL